jgi:plasmid maintenance system antidote protein VapI
MKTYTDADVRTALAELVEESTYRSVAANIGIDHANLHRIIHGEREITLEAASAVGFAPIERKWLRKSPK